jgi:hypothetical protein
MLDRNISDGQKTVDATVAELDGLPQDYIDPQKPDKLECVDRASTPYGKVHGRILSVLETYPGMTKTLLENDVTA